MAFTHLIHTNLGNTSSRLRIDLEKAFFLDLLQYFSNWGTFNPQFVHSDLSREWGNLVEAHNEQSGDAALCELAEQKAGDD